MSETCEMMDKCPFYNAFTGNQEIRKKIWVSVFCWDLSNSAQCVRKKVRGETGQPPPPNLSPLGKMYNEAEYRKERILTTTRGN